VFIHHVTIPSTWPNSPSDCLWGRPDPGPYPMLGSLLAHASASTTISQLSKNWLLKDSKTDLRQIWTTVAEGSSAGPCPGYQSYAQKPQLTKDGLGQGRGGIGYYMPLTILYHPDGCVVIGEWDHTFEHQPSDWVPDQVQFLEESLQRFTWINCIVVTGTAT